MDIGIVREQEFIPEWNGNKDEKEPIVFVLRALSGERRVACMEHRISVNGELELIPDYIKFFKYGTKEIRNLTVKDEPIKTAIDCLSSDGMGLDQLIREVGTQVWIANMEKDSKNLQ